MGRRSWFTSVKSLDDWKKFKQALKDNPQSDGIVYVALVKEDAKPFGGEVIVAWQGDGNGSLFIDMPAEYRPITRTRLLEQCMDIDRKWKTAVDKITERFFYDEAEVEAYLAGKGTVAGPPDPQSLEDGS